MPRLSTMFLLAILSAGLPAAQQITDPAEYNAYNAVKTEAQPAAKVKLADDFLAKYPNSVVKETILQEKLQAQQAANQPYEATAKALLEINPKNIQALFMATYAFQIAPAQKGDDPRVAAAEDLSRRGIQEIGSLKKPEGVSDADFEKSKKTTEASFYHTIGVAGAVKGDFAAAQEALKKAFEIQPDNATISYRLAEAYRGSKPPKNIESLFAYARTLTINGPLALNDAGKKQVKDFLARYYRSYHGNEEGLADLEAAAAGSMFPPAGLKIKTREEVKKEILEKAEAERRAKLLAADPKQLSFPEMKEIVGMGAPHADNMFGKVKGDALRLRGKVVSSAPATKAKTVRIAVVVPADAPAGTYDVEMTLETASAVAIPDGAAIEFEASLDGYTPSPVAFVMTEGKITKGVGPVAPVKPAPRRPAAKKPG